MSKVIRAKSGMIRLGIMSGCLVLMFVLGGCAKYTPKPFNVPVGISQEKKDIAVTASRLSDLDCSYYFSRKIISKGYQPIQLVIQNKSDRTLMLDAQNIDLEIEPVYRVTKSLHLNTVKRVIIWCLPALILWPFIIPAAVDGLGCADANKRLDRDFGQRTLNAHGIITIPPYSFINKVFFVTTENYRQKFDVVLIDRKGAEYPFTLHV